MRTIRTLRRSNEGILNSLLKSKKTESFVILYHSEWCPYSNAILDLAKEWSEREGDETLFVVSSWELPHAFAAFAVTVTPTVVEAANGKVTVHVEYPKVHEYFTHNPEENRRRPKSKSLKRQLHTPGNR